MKSVSKMLFGGAVLFAGIAAGSANAANFVFSGGAGDEEAYDKLNFTFASTDGFSGAPNSVYDAQNDFRFGAGTAYMYANSTSMGVETTAYSLASGPAGKAYATLDILNFTVDSNTNAGYANWSFTTFGDATATATFTLTNISTSSVLVNQSVIGTSGSITGITFNAGDQYQLAIDFFTDIGTSNNTANSGFLSASIHVPTPGAMALLGLAGIVGRKRRRRD